MTWAKVASVVGKIADIARKLMNYAMQANSELTQYWIN